MTQQIDPWDQTTVLAQKAFDDSPAFDDEQIEWARDFHDNVATTSDEARVAALKGDKDQILAWYWTEGAE